MKLNSPWKALLWEELYVAGSIICVILAGCGWCALSCRILSPEIFIQWQDVDIFCYLVVYATSLLFLLQIGNSGEMHISIPRRILCLPVPSYLIVTISLFTRTFLIVISTLLSRIIVASILAIYSPYLEFSENHQYIDTFRRIFPFEFHFFIPLIIPSVIHSIVYITLQFLCWFFILNPFLMGVITFLFTFTLITVLIFDDFEIIDVIFSGLLPISDSVSEYKISVPGYIYFCFFILLIIYVLIIWFLSIKFTSKVRAGVRRDLKSLFPLQYLDSLNKLEVGMLIKKFSSSQTAQVWFELNNNGLIIPKWTFIFWFLISVLHLLILLVSKYVHSNLGLLDIYASTTINLVSPLVAMILAGVVWYLKVTRKMKRNFKSDIFQLSHVPTTRKERIYSYWLAGNINLIITLPVIWLMEFTFLYMKFKIHVFPDPTLVNMNMDVFQLPFSNTTLFLSSLIIYTSGITLLVGLIIWLMMFSPSTILVFSFLVLCLLIPNNTFSMPSIMEEFYFTLYHFFNIGDIISDIIRLIKNILFSHFPSLRECFPSSLNFIFHIVYFYSVIMFFAYLFIAARNRLLGKKEKYFLLIFYICTFVCIMPWYLWGKINPSLFVGTYLFLSAIFSGAWLKILLFSHGYRWRSQVFNFSGNMLKYTAKDENLFYLLFGYLIIIFFVILMAVSRIKPGISEKCAAFFQENSLPATVNEMSKKYHSVPDSENLAKKYFGLSSLRKELMYEEMKLLEKYRRSISTYSCPQRKRDFMEEIINDNYSVLMRRDLPLPEFAYYTYKEYYEKVYRKLTEELHKIAESGLEKGHYPIDLKKGFSMELPHLAMLRDFIWKLGLEAVLSAIDEDYDTMLRAFRTSASVYNSLENEPVYISQLVRIVMFGIMYGNMEWIFNHKELPECVLLELNDIIQNFAIPLEKRSLFNNALHYETLLLMDTTPMYYNEAFLHEVNDWTKILDYRHKRDIFRSWLPLIDAFYPIEIEQMVALNLYTVLRETANEVAREENIEIPAKQFLDSYSTRLLEPQRNNFLFISTPPYWFYYTLFVNYPGLSRCMDVKLRHIVFINLAQTAIAIERFRLKNNRLPDELQDLVPDYLPAVPRDPWRKGKLIKYIKGADFSYNIYSIGVDKEDDDGIDRDEEKGIGSIIEGDFIFSVLPLSVRQEPDVSTDASLLTPYQQ